MRVHVFLAGTQSGSQNGAPSVPGCLLAPSLAHLFVSRLSLQPHVPSTMQGCSSFVSVFVAHMEALALPCAPTTSAVPPKASFDITGTYVLTSDRHCRACIILRTSPKTTSLQREPYTTKRHQPEPSSYLLCARIAYLFHAMNLLPYARGKQCAQEESNRVTIATLCSHNHWMAFRTTLQRRGSANALCVAFYQTLPLH